MEYGFCFRCFIWWQEVADLTIVDAFTRESPLIGVGFTYKGHDVVHTLEEAAQKHGYPRTLRIDNGPEFISKHLDLCGPMHTM